MTNVHFASRSGSFLQGHRSDDWLWATRFLESHVEVRHTHHYPCKSPSCFHLGQLTIILVDYNEKIYHDQCLAFLTVDQTLKETPKEEASWSENVDGVQVFSFAGFVWWFCQYLCKWNTFFRGKCELHNVHPCWLASMHPSEPTKRNKEKKKKPHLAHDIFLPHMLALFMTSQIWSDWQHSCFFFFFLWLSGVCFFWTI